MQFLEIYAGRAVSIQKSTSRTSIEYLCLMIDLMTYLVIYFMAYVLCLILCAMPHGLHVLFLINLRCLDSCLVGFFYIYDWFFI